MGKSSIIKIIIFVSLLLLANLFLLKSGFWFFQDAGYWPKTSQEAFLILNQQFQSFTAYGYFTGFDQGLFSFTRILVVGFISFIFYIFKQSNSQIIFTFAGYILSFVSFYLLSGIFFKEKRYRYILSLTYVFNPLSYTLQGYVFFNAAIPLFIYSFNKYFFNAEGFRTKYLLINIFASFIWVSYIRFVQGYSFIIIPYLLYLIFRNREKLRIKKIVIYICSYLLVFAPITFAFVSQLLEKSDTAFNYGSIFGNFVAKHKMYDSFNLFQSVGAKLYEGKWWSVLGLFFFGYLVYLIATFSKKKYSVFYFLNLMLVLFGIAMYGMGNIFGNVIYLKVIHFLPFIINEPYWAMSILGVPYIMLLGLLTKDRIKNLYIFAFFFITFSILPLLNLSDFQLQKFDLSNVPRPYYDYFIKPNHTVPESTYFFHDKCWRAKYMDDANVPTFCLNYGLRFVSILLGDPRLTSGEELDLVDDLYGNTNIDNLRITHNLKNIIVPNDIVDKKGIASIARVEEIQKINQAQVIFDNNSLLRVVKNNNFSHYSYKDKDLYNFFIYSPKTILYSQNLNIPTDNTLDIDTRPVILPRNASNIPDVISSNVNIEYKVSPHEPYKYYLHVTNIDNIRTFLIQFNQKYSSYWKMKLVSKAYYDGKPCITSWKIFPITNNSYCQYKNSLMDLGDAVLLKKQNISELKHFEGNFLSNTWVISPKDSQKKNELYLVIIYTKQIYYSYAILITALTLVILLFISIIQEGRVVKRHSK